MKYDHIEINKDEMPYSFDILLADELFNMTVSHNETHDIFTVAISSDGEMICEGEPLVYGFPLFGDFYQTDVFPCIDIIPLDESGQQNAVTFKNLGDTVFLIIDNQDESGEDIE